MKRFWIAGALALVLASAGATKEKGTREVSASLHNATGADVGRATARQEAGGIRLRVTVTGLPPGVHGIHVHAVGRCDPPDFASAGSHWNPAARQHGRENPQGMHAGDLPNLTVGPNGRGHLDALIPHASLAGGAGAMLDADGAALVIHAMRDDERTDPSGNSGARIACGVFG